MPNDKEQKEKIRQLIREIVVSDEVLREKYNMGTKFRFIRDRLQNLLARVEEEITAINDKQEFKQTIQAADEIEIYVHIFNAQGLILSSWQKLLSPSVYYEYSVNRPVYLQKKAIDTFIRTRTNINQHAYLTFVIKKTDLIKQVENEITYDALGQPLAKIKEGALQADKLISFVHNDIQYRLDADNNLRRINDAE